MPRQYEAIRDKMAAKGMDYDEAQMHAAKIYNAAHPGRPMGGGDHVMRAKRRHKAKKALAGYK